MIIYCFREEKNSLTASDENNSGIRDGSTFLALLYLRWLACI